MSNYQPLSAIIGKYGPKVATPFTKGGRAYMVTGRTRTHYILRRLDPMEGEDEFIEVAEEKFSIRTQ